MLSIFLVSYVNPPKRVRKAPASPNTSGPKGKAISAGNGKESLGPAASERIGGGVGSDPPAIAEALGNGELAHAVEVEEVGTAVQTNIQKSE